MSDAIHGIYILSDHSGKPFYVGALRFPEYTYRKMITKMKARLRSHVGASLSGKRQSIPKNLLSAGSYRYEETGDLQVTAECRGSTIRMNVESLEDPLRWEMKEREIILSISEEHKLTNKKFTKEYYERLRNSEEKAESERVARQARPRLPRRPIHWEHMNRKAKQEWLADRGMTEEDYRR